MWADACDPTRDDFRRWIEDELAGLDNETRAQFVARLGEPRQHTSAAAELATGYALRGPGTTIQYEPDLDSTTPDLIVTSPNGDRLVVEVWRRNLPGDVLRRNRGWAELSRHLERLQFPVVLRIEGIEGQIIDAPSVQTRKVIVTSVQRQLAQGRDVDIRVSALRITVVGESYAGHVQVLPVASAGVGNRKQVLDAIDQKVKRYRDRLEAHDLPFLLVLSAEPNTGLDRDHLEAVLSGANRVTVPILGSHVGAIDSGPVEFQLNDSPPPLSSTLSAIAWLDLHCGADSELSPVLFNPIATRPITLPRFDRDSVANPHV